MIEIPKEAPDDVSDIRRVNEDAFGLGEEADIVDELRRQGAMTLSLVAIDSGEIVGHILFSPVTIEADASIAQAIGLGPMAVITPRQRQGIGSELVKVGLEECAQLGHELVIVLGHLEYHPRSGFESSQKHDIRWEYECPSEVFMVKELRAGALAKFAGIVKYHPAFGSA